MPTSLVVGGTGVTGSFVVAGLLRRSHTVTVAHTGRHKPARADAPWYYDGSVRVLLTGVDDADELATTLVRVDGADFFFDHVFVLYGKLRVTAPLFAGAGGGSDGRRRCGRFYSAGGSVVYDTYGTSTAPWAVAGNVLGCTALAEDTPLMTTDGTLTGTANSFNPKLNKIIETDKAVFAAHPEATHVRYGEIYGPNNILPRMWMVVKRVLDGRPGIIVSPMANHAMAGGGCAYGANAAQYFLLAVDRPGQSKGQIFNAFETQVPTMKQWILIIARALGRPDFRVFELPTELAVPSRPLTPGFEDDLPPPGGTRGVFTNHKGRALLGYTDVVPVVEAISRTARWLARPENHVDAKVSRGILQDPFNYRAEDELLAAW
eukprot:g3401.t1